MTETWRPIPGWKGYYEASDLGALRSVPRTTNGVVWRGSLMKPQLRLGKHHAPRYVVKLFRDGRALTRGVGTLVLTAFVGPCPGGLECCHNNGDAADNRLDNLRWDTHSSNVIDTTLHGTHACALRTNCPRGHELPPYTPGMKRKCLACKRARYYANKAKSSQ